MVWQKTIQGKSGANFHLNAKMNWFDFGALTSKVKVTMTSCYCVSVVKDKVTATFICSQKRNRSAEANNRSAIINVNVRNAFWLVSQCYLADGLIMMLSSECWTPTQVISERNKKMWTIHNASQHIQLPLWVIRKLNRCGGWCSWGMTLHKLQTNSIMTRGFNRKSNTGFDPQLHSVDSEWRMCL